MKPAERANGHNGPRRRATDHEEADVSAPRRPDGSETDRDPDTAPDSTLGLPAGMLEALYSRPSRARTALVVVPRATCPSANSNLLPSSFQKERLGQHFNSRKNSRR